MAELTRSLTLAPPDQDQADRGQSGAVISPLYLADHEARRRPIDRAGALTDPEQAECDREEAGDQKRLTHGVPSFGWPHRRRASGFFQWRARSPGASGGRNAGGLFEEVQKSPGNAGALKLSKFERDQYFATTGPVQLKR